MGLFNSLLRPASIKTPLFVPKEGQTMNIGDINFKKKPTIFCMRAQVLTGKGSRRNLNVAIYVSSEIITYHVTALHKTFAKNEYCFRKKASFYYFFSQNPTFKRNEVRYNFGAITVPTAGSELNRGQGNPQSSSPFFNWQP